MKDQKNMKTLKLKKMTISNLEKSSIKGGELIGPPIGMSDRYHCSGECSFTC